MAKVSEQVTCRKCGETYVPSFQFDFYPDGEDPKVGLCERCFMAEAFDSLHKEPVPIPAGYEQTVCRRGQGDATCSFLGTPGGAFQCLKNSMFEATIRQRREEGSIRAKGDNCSGPPDFRPTATPA